MIGATVKEAQVRDSLAGCLEKLEPGLTFLDKESRLPSSIGTTGFIDLLAEDSEQRYVLVEVKRTDSATRETLHEVLKYIEGAKAHFGLRENELRVIIASVEWRELLVPFSSFIHRTTCRVEGYRLQIDHAGTVVAAEIVEPLPIHSERLLAPWHELRFYKDEEKLLAGIASYENANAAKALESFVLIILDAPPGNPDGFPSTKQITNRGVLALMAEGMGKPAKEIPDELYKSAIYFAMQQLSREEYIDRLPAGNEFTLETLESVESMAEEEALCTLHEAVLHLDPRPDDDFFEIGYAAKFKSRLIEEEGWRIREIRRYGSFKRNAFLTDETIIEEIGGAQGNSYQNLKMSFYPNQKADVAEVRRRLDACLKDNEPWRSQIDFVLNELVICGESRRCYIHIMNHSSAITTVYLSASRPDGALYIPMYHICVPEEEPERMYFGALKHNGGKPRTLTQILNEFYEGKVAQLLSTLLWGGYESRDVKIVRRLGLRYKTFQVQLSGDDRQFFELDDHAWEECAPIDSITSYFSFLERFEDFTREVYDLYSSRWDGHVVALHEED